MKKRITLLLTMLFVLVLHTVSFAAEKKVDMSEYNPKTMTFEERAKWVEENIEPIYVGTAQGIERTEWLYTSTKTDTVGPAQYDVGKLQTRVKFTVDEDENVTDWSTVTFRATNLTNAIVDTDYFDTEIAPHNIRIVYEAWFTEVSGAYFIEHWYNLHGNGAYDVRVVSGGDS